MTQTCEQLWGDIAFIEKRIKEQLVYRRQLDMRRLPVDRFKALRDSCHFILRKFLMRYYQLKYGY